MRLVFITIALANLPHHPIPLLSPPPFRYKNIVGLKGGFETLGSSPKWARLIGKEEKAAVRMLTGAS